MVLLPGVKAQNTVSYRMVLDDRQVPKEVIAGFNAKYPGDLFTIWYSSHITYWYEDYAQNWYGEWYPKRQVVVHRFEKPAYYEVDFRIDNLPSRAIFNRYGQWIETRAKLSTLPDAVTTGLRNSEFGDWLWSAHKERIEILGNEGLIYRLVVTDRRNTYIVRLNEAGEIVQVKYE